MIAVDMNAGEIFCGDRNPERLCMTGIKLIREKLMTGLMYFNK